MDQKPFKRLEQIRLRNTTDPNWINQDLYRFLYRPEFYISAYEKIKDPSLTYFGLRAKETKLYLVSCKKTKEGFDERTLDPESTHNTGENAPLKHLNLLRITELIEEMRGNRFRFQPVRRILVPKANSKTPCPLMITSLTDKVVQEIIRTILETIYEPTFSECSHGFRPNRSCHTALQQIDQQFDGIKWLVRGEIEGCNRLTNNIDHKILIQILRRRIKDERFIGLIIDALKVGSIETSKLGNPASQRIRASSSIGIPQGSALSPILSNIYLDRLDSFVETLRARYSTPPGERKRKTTKIYNRLRTLISKTETLISQSSDPQEWRELVKEVRRLKLERVSVQAYEAESAPIVIRYVRYANDWLIGVNGPKKIAEQISEEVSNFLKSELGLSLNDEKTRLLYLKRDKALFLGYEIRIEDSVKILKLSTPSKKTYYKRTTGNFIKLDAPIGGLISQLCAKGFCNGNGKPLSKRSWTVQEDFRIVQAYNGLLNGLINYYSGADNMRKLIRIQYILQHSCASTLAHKHRSSVKKIYSLHGPDLCVKRVLSFDKGEVARRVSLHLRRFNKDQQRWLIDLDRKDPFQVYINRRTRSKSSENCIVCGRVREIEMHHINSVRKATRSNSEGFAQVKGLIERKQIPICKSCHEKIHNGQYDGFKLSHLPLSHKKQSFCQESKAPRIFS